MAGSYPENCTQASLILEQGVPAESTRNCHCDQVSRQILGSVCLIVCAMGCVQLKLPSRGLYSGYLLQLDGFEPAFGKESLAFFYLLRLCSQYLRSTAREPVSGEETYIQWMFPGFVWAGMWAFSPAPCRRAQLSGCSEGGEGIMQRGTRTETSPDC